MGQERKGRESESDYCSVFAGPVPDMDPTRLGYGRRSRTVRGGRVQDGPDKVIKVDDRDGGPRGESGDRNTDIPFEDFDRPNSTIGRNLRGKCQNRPHTDPNSKGPRPTGSFPS